MKLPNWAWPQWLLRYIGRRLAQFNPRTRARRNVAHHYDLDGRLYSLFLDADRQYSCALFRKAGHIARRRAAREETSSCGQAEARAETSACSTSAVAGAGSASISPKFGGANVTGITLSHEQHAIANERAAEKGLKRARPFPVAGLSRLAPGRLIASSRLACSNMSASVTTIPSSKKCATLLADDGVMVLHSIGRSEGPSVTNPWIAKYIFPGGYIPALSEVLPEIEQAGLLVTDIEILRLHYAETLKALARAVPGPSRGSRAHLRPALRADVGILSRSVRNVVPRAEHDGHADPAHQAAGRGANHARLYLQRGAAFRRCRKQASAATAARRRIDRGRSTRASPATVKKKPVFPTARYSL